MKPINIRSPRKPEINRRAALVGANASLAAASLSPVAKPPAIEVTIRTNDRTYRIATAAARDVGAFVSEIGDFIQDCYRADIDDLGMTIFFRPDRGSDRLEVVIETGRIFSGPPRHLEAYDVDIVVAGAATASVHIPVHYWRSRWRWQSRERPVVGDIDKLISERLLPPLVVRRAETADVSTVAAAPISGLPTTGAINAELGSRVTAKGAALGLVSRDSAGKTDAPPGVTSQNPAGGPTYSYMGLAGVTAYMPQTGERPDIGLLTEPQAEYVVTRSAASLAVVRAQAEAAGTIPWHFRDERTGAPFNFETYQDGSWYANPPGANPVVKTIESPITVDAAHQPALAYIPYLLTGDPYFLEELQFQSTWNWGAEPPGYRPTWQQSRAIAWSLRTLAQAARVTPERVPGWLLPQGYWQRQLEQCRVFYEKRYMTDPAPPRALFRSTFNLDYSKDEGPKAPYGTWIDPWQEEFLANVLGWVVAMGFESWRTFFKWKVTSTITRTDSRGPWQRAYATPYRILLRSTQTAPWVTSWAEAWALNVRQQEWAVQEPDIWVDSDRTYLGYSRGALIYAHILGIADVSEAITWAGRELAKGGWKVPHKWQLGLPAP